MLKAIDVYLERRKTRQHAGRLSRAGKKFVFEYSEAYRLSPNPLAFGPELPLHKKKLSSLKLFPSFADRIPMRQNPAYGEYCQAAGISPAETDPMILLAALGRRAPSSFILEPVWEKPPFSRGDLRRFRARLGLSIREFAVLFEISPSAVHRIERGKTSGRRALRQIEPYAKNPQAALEKMRQRGFKINEAKKLAAESSIRSGMPAAAAPGPWTVRAEDVAKCSPEQAAELLRRLTLTECDLWGIPQSGAHVSENISAPDGGQDGLIKWAEGPPKTHFFPRRYSCFQMKAKPVKPSECKKEALNSKGDLKPAIKEAIKNRGAYVLCSTHEAAGVQINEREDALKQAILKGLRRKPSSGKKQNQGGQKSPPAKTAAKAGSPVEALFYDGNKLAGWANCHPSVAVWLLKEVCGRPLGPWLSWMEWSREDEDFSGSQFMFHRELETKKHSLYEALAAPRQTARLIGASGLGKTRLALEAFRPEACSGRALSQAGPRAAASPGGYPKGIPLLKAQSSLEESPKYIYEENPKNAAAGAALSKAGLKKRDKSRPEKRAPKDDLSPLILYSSADSLQESDLRAIKTARAIVIADDCPTEKAEAFHKIAHQKDSRLSLLTIEHESKALKAELSPPGKIHKIELEPDDEIAKKILSESQDITNKDFHPAALEIIEGFPLMAKLLRGAGPSDLLKNDVQKIKNKMLFGLRKPNDEALKAIKACALFEDICFEPDEWGRKRLLISSSNMSRNPEEARYIAENICQMSYDEFYKHIQFFKKRKIIQQTGSFIKLRPKPLAVWLAREFFEENPAKSIFQWLSDMKSPAESEKAPGKESEPARKLLGSLSKEEKTALEQYQKDFLILHGLRESFCRQLVWLKRSSAEAKKLAERLCEEGGLFGSEDALNTEWGSRCFLELLPLCPKTALQTLHQIYGKKPAAEFLKEKSRAGAPSFSYMSRMSLLASREGLLPYEGAMNLIEALQKLAAKKALYPMAARLLLKFAEGERPNNSGGSAQNIFAGHFQLLLSGTEAEPAEKFQIIEEIKQFGSLNQKKIAVMALGKALQGRYFSRSNFAGDYRTEEHLKDWQPKTEEVLRYQRQAMELLTQFALGHAMRGSAAAERGAKNQPAEIQEMAQTAIASHLPGMFWGGLRGEWEKSVKAIFAARGENWPLAAKKLLDFLNINQEKLKAEQKKWAESLIDSLQPKDDLAERLRFYIAECPWVYLYSEKKPKQEYEARFGRLLRDAASHLKSAGQAADSPCPPPPWLQVLFHGEQRNTARFARELAGKLPDPPRFAFNLLETLKQWKTNKGFNPSFLCGFIQGLEDLDKKTDKKKAAPAAPGRSRQAAAAPAQYKNLILDKIAGSSSLRSLLPAAYSNISAKDEDITRLLNVMDEADWPAKDLEWALAIRQKCHSASPEAISQLLSKLSGKSAAGARAALCICEAYMEGQTPAVKEKMLPAVFDLLTKQRLFARDEAPSSSSRWRLAFRIIINSGEILESDIYGSQFARFFVSQLIHSESSLYDWPIGHETAEECLQKILEKRPDDVLSKTAKILSETEKNSGEYPPEKKANARQKLGLLFRNKNLNWEKCFFPPLSAVPVEILKACCAKAPDQIPAFLAKILPLFSYDKNKGRHSWSGFARFLFDEYGDRQDVARAVSMRLNNFSYTGKFSDYFQPIKAVVEELESHKRKPVRDFAEKCLEDLEKRAAYESRLEKERELFRPS